METNKKITIAKSSTDFDAERFVSRLLAEGSNTPCDETERSFNNEDELPEYYNEQRYKRGQAFYHKYIFSLFFGKILGLISVLLIPSILNILKFTKMSSSNLSAYRRYLTTVFHMVVWYEKDFKPGSKLWKSIQEVKSRHNSASKKACAAGLHRINQKDMALTQFGFMGYALCKPKKIGLQNVTDDDIKDFVYLWRVVGFVMGIHERFNICRESVSETRQICTILAEKVFKKMMDRRNEDFMIMSKYLVDGMWSMSPILDHKVFLCYINDVLLTPSPSNNNNNNNDHEEQKTLFKLSFRENALYGLIIRYTYFMKYTVVRLFHNYLQYLTLWLMKVCPFLGYYQFGYKNSHVNILTKED